VSRELYAVRWWKVDQNLRIVEETVVPGASVSMVARRHDVNANLVFEWRKWYRRGTLANRNKASATPNLPQIGVIEPMVVSVRSRW